MFDLTIEDVALSVHTEQFQESGTSHARNDFYVRVIALVQLYFHEGVNGEKWKATSPSQLLSLLAYFFL